MSGASGRSVRVSPLTMRQGPVSVGQSVSACFGPPADPSSTRSQEY